MEFLKSNEINLNPAGYLVSTATNKPVIHKEFVEQQKRAEYVVKLADAIKNKNFKVQQVDNLDAIKEQVRKSIEENNVKNYISAPEKPISQVNEELVKFALDYASYGEKKNESTKINAFMQTFNSISSVEEVGDYFIEGLVKLNKIYTIGEILTAVQINIDKIN